MAIDLPIDDAIAVITRYRSEWLDVLDAATENVRVTVQG
jgi:ferric-dicitrate binding protein FerR (iron transport regulator)